MKTDDYTVEAENVACAGSISQSMDFPPAVASGLPSCTKTVTVRAFPGLLIPQTYNTLIPGKLI